MKAMRDCMLQVARPWERMARCFVFSALRPSGDIWRPVASFAEDILSTHGNIRDLACLPVSSAVPVELNLGLRAT